MSGVEGIPMEHHGATLRAARLTALEGELVRREVEPPQLGLQPERVIRAGEMGSEMFFISSGAVEVVIGRKRIHFGPGDLFGEMALLSGGVRTADVTAIDYCSFLTVEQQDVRAFVSRHPDLRAKFDRIAVQRAAMNPCELAMGEAPA
jgi:CRP-like cAMP-binding protein